jgi:rhodanese-related sulfurtransferase
VFLDARDPAEFAAGSGKGARNVPASLIAGKDTGEVKKARSSTARSP